MPGVQENKPEEQNSEWRARLEALLKMTVTDSEARGNRVRALACLFEEIDGCGAARDQAAERMKKDIRALLDHGRNKSFWTSLPDDMRLAITKRVCKKHEEYGRGLTGREIELMVSMRIWRMLPRKYRVIGIAPQTIKLWEAQADSGGLDAALLAALPEAFMRNLDDAFFTDIIAKTEYEDVCARAFDSWKNRYEEMPEDALAHLVKIAATGLNTEVCRQAWDMIAASGAPLSKKDYLEIFIYSRNEQVAHEASIMGVKLYEQDMERGDYMQIFLLHRSPEIRALAAETIFALYALDGSVPDDEFRAIAQRTDDPEIAGKAERIIGYRRIHRLHAKTLTREKLQQEKLRLERQWKAAVLAEERTAHMPHERECATWEQAAAWERGGLVSESVWLKISGDYREDKKNGMQLDYLHKFILKIKDREICDQALHLFQKKFRWELEVDELGKPYFMQIALNAASDWAAFEAGHILIHEYEEYLETSDLRDLMKHRHAEIRKEAAAMLHQSKAAL